MLCPCAERGQQSITQERFTKWLSEGWAARAMGHRTSRPFPSLSRLEAEACASKRAKACFYFTRSEAEEVMVGNRRENNPKREVTAHAR